jgi:uncharacterized protein involved in tolerance to divalent cations
MTAALIWCPFPDRETARRIAGQLLADGLVACANIMAEMESLFMWEGKADSAAEVGVCSRRAPTGWSAQLHDWARCIRMIPRQSWAGSATRPIP